ncbi:MULTISPECIES: response regulator transcription factor [unclassified Acidovorax]|uniref:response regulator transcription factor n=1 Tax=unclassified Acidovorax TaxID=2684926 RepID=UPI0023DE2646|nr:MULTISPECIES: response regulator transcription factor [unclassified Acidovorax]GKS92833.1 response regulator transcription factor [Acidovorax sp. SUPP2539]GKS97563.1 response regulator transcription factor [Acidovorax sp. SUPP2825]
MSRVLVIEDDPGTASAIAMALHDAGHATEHVGDGRMGLVRALAGDFDVIVLDRMLPALDGLALLAALRLAGGHAPVLILSALSALDERVRGLRAGGDDYLAKPFEAMELVARVEALVRRTRAAPATGRETQLCVGDLQVDLLTRTVRRGARSIDLVPREHDLLVYLMKHAGQIVTRTMLFEAVWNYRYEERTNVIEVHIGRLRRKVDAPGEVPMIQTVRGAGYAIHAPV